MKSKDGRSMEVNDEDGVRGVVGAAAADAQVKSHAPVVPAASQTPVKHLRERHEALAAEATSVATRSRKERKATMNDEGRGGGEGERAKGVTEVIQAEKGNETYMARASGNDNWKRMVHTWP